jgi:hypothetical protein
VSGASERACRSGDRIHQGICSTAAARLIADNPRCDAQFAEGRNFAHALDFNSLAGLQWRNVAAVNRSAADRIRLCRKRSRGGSVDPQLKQLMKELGDAINESLSDSEQISEVVSRIKEGGYDIFLVLEATIGVSKQGEKNPDKTSLVTTMSSNPELKVSDQDLKFLKSLRIKIDEEKHDKEK